MMVRRFLNYLGMALFIIFVTACDTTPDKQPNTASTDAIAAAKAANQRAIKEKYEWRDTGKLIKKAEKALASGNNTTAIKLANKARRQAELAVKQKYNELKRLEHMFESPLIESKIDGYNIVQGDNLWNIAAKLGAYGNPYQWPLIYKMNRGKINDADLIYPGQQLIIDSTISSDDKSAAVEQAKNRGSWTLGKVELTDKVYLNK